MSKRSELEWACLQMNGLKKKYPELQSGFVRPVYQYTSQENNTVTQLHADDYQKDNWRP